MKPSLDKRMPVLRHSFTLIELLAVIAVIVILAGLLLGGARIAMQKASEGKTRSQIHQLEIAFEQYRQEWGFYPLQPTATILWKTIMTGTDDSGTYYHGLESKLSNSNTHQYFFTRESFKFSTTSCVDPFGKDYYYQYPGTVNKNGFDIWSAGADGYFGNPANTSTRSTPTAAQSTAGAAINSDDINNWKR